MWATLKQDVLARLPREPVNGTFNGVHAEPTAAQADWDARLADLARYRTYTDDWDGQGAAGIPAALIDGAADLAASLRRHGVAAPACVLPGVQGTVGFEWDLAGGGSVSLEVIEPGTADLFSYSPGKGVEHTVLTESVTA